MKINKEIRFIKRDTKDELINLFEHSSPRYSAIGRCYFCVAFLIYLSEIALFGLGSIDDVPAFWLSLLKQVRLDR